MAKVLPNLLLAFWVTALLATLCESVSDIYYGFTYECSHNLHVALNSLWQVFDLVRKPAWFALCYSNQSFLKGVCNICLVGAAFKLLPIADKSLRMRLENPVNLKLFSDVCETVPIFKILATGFIVVSNAWCMFGIIDSTLLTFHYGIRDLSHAIDGLGQYEMGEKLFSLTSRASGRTLASSFGPYYGHDSDLKEIANERLNRIVEKIYGAQSLEMALRQQVLANHIRSNFDLLPLAMQARTKAIAIYARLGRSYYQAINMAFLAFDQAEMGNVAEAKNLIDKALTLANGLDIDDRSSVEDEAYCVFRSIGEKQRAKEILETINDRAKHANDQLQHPEALPCLVLFLMFVFALRETKKRFLQYLEHEWGKYLNQATTEAEKFLWLNRLVNLHLFSKENHSADECSKQLLCAAERLPPSN